MIVCSDSFCKRVARRHCLVLLDFRPHLTQPRHRMPEPPQRSANGKELAVLIEECTASPSMWHVGIADVGGVYNWSNNDSPVTRENVC